MSIQTVLIADMQIHARAGGEGFEKFAPQVAFFLGYFNCAHLLSSCGHETLWG